MKSLRQPICVYKVTEEQSEAHAQYSCKLGSSATSRLQHPVSYAWQIYRDLDCHGHAILPALSGPRATVARLLVNSGFPGIGIHG